MDGSRMEGRTVCGLRGFNQSGQEKNFINILL